jgi:hypothetical protein
MFKRLAILVCLLTITTTQFAMLYEEDGDNIFLVGVLTQPGERYPVSFVKRRNSIKPLKELTQNTEKKEKNRESCCLSILNFLLQQYQHAHPVPYLM